MTSSFLLDTCTCIWLIAGTLPASSLQQLTDAYNADLQTYISPITALEIGIQARKGRFKSHLTPQNWLATLSKLPGMATAHMPPELLLDSALLPGDLQGDQADRIIAATARAYGFTVMTRDHALLDYGRQGYLSVVAC
jgi:PIN domain nuclease of toxin-antitoxin system